MVESDTRRPRGAINSNAKRVVILAYDNSSEKEDYALVVLPIAVIEIVSRFLRD